MTLQFDQSHILEECGQRAFERGQRYWREGRVLKLEVERDLLELKIRSRVRGGRLYSQSIEVLAFGGDEIEILGDCSCPVGLNCKHVAAALLRVLEEGGGDPAPDPRVTWEEWLSQLKQAVITSAERGSTFNLSQGQYCLLYLLRPDPHRASHRVEVKSYKVRRLKRGGYGKTAPYSLERIRSYYTDPFVQSEDKDIARTLVADTTGYFDYNNDYPLEREFGELALKTLLASGRCHWLEPETPALRRGSDRPMEFQWLAEAGGKRLRPVIDPAAEQLLVLENLWYLDLDRHTVGRLTHPRLSRDQAVALLDAPLVPEQRLEQVSRQLVLEMADYDLPTPVPVDIERIRLSGESMVPQLRLHSLQAAAAPSDEGQWHCARLGFGYGPVLLEGFDERARSQVVRQEQIYVIDRDLEAERGAMEQLQQMGLRPLSEPRVDRPLDWVFGEDSAPETAFGWQRFLDQQLPELRDQGWRVLTDDSFHLRFEEPEAWHAALDEQATDWFSLSLGVELEGRRINLLPALVDVLSRAGSPQRLREYLGAQPHVLLPAGDHRWLKLPSERLRPIFDTLVELYDHDPLDREGQLALSRHQGLQIGALFDEPALHWRGAEGLRRLCRKLVDFEGIAPVAPPAGFKAQLRPYQCEGLSWLQFLQGYGFHGILADDMGLGKTVQTLAHLLLEKQSGRMDRPALVIAPTSLMSNWRREAERFTPQLKVLLIHGSDRHARFDEIDQHDLVLTTYPLLRRDRDRLLERAFHCVILDESQAIKNPRSQTAQVVYGLNARQRLCLTGTPMENHLGELWSMFHFLMPGFLGDLDRFNRLFRAPVERQGDEARRQQLRRRIQPFLLRRTKARVAAELPEKSEIVRSVALQGRQRDLYETIRLAMDKRVRQAISKQGLARSHIMILDALLKLRQVCCDPRLLPMEQAQRVTQSAKLDLLMQMLPELVEEGRRVLLFSQFTRMLGLIESELERRHIPYSKLTGQTRKRDAAIERFQSGEAPVFLISLKAGGVGLNLTAADTVIHYDPWWNPAVESQATDRAHRIGQERAVFVYKLVTEQTVEEKIIAMQKRKQALADALYSGESGEQAPRFSAQELTALLRPLGE